jgi:2-C-methyl-D-erythritol 4-phosphate cytidylyltransferase
MVSAILVAAGSGIRMKSSLPKQYHLLDGLPMLCHPLLSIDACGEIDDIVLVLSEKDFDYCRGNVLRPLNLQKPVKCVTGGAERQESVFNGLAEIGTWDRDTDVVVIHDGVRPFIRPQELSACVRQARASGACILGIPVSDTLKRVNPSGTIDKTLERDAVWRAQTPQAFRYPLIKRAHEYARQESFSGTDDAVLVERLGWDVTILEGSRRNIKITTPEDLMLAEVMIATGA